MSAPSVYASINAITAELARNGIPKSHTNATDDYKYRSIDDVLNRLAPLLAMHNLCILPRALERTVTERADDQNRLLFHVALRVSFTLTSVDDGTSHVVESYGEALDGGDKATAKAMSAAYKMAMVQTFCISVGAAEDADRSSHRLTSKSHSAEPVQGWTQWCLDIEDIVSLCESEQAITMVQERNRELLRALSREQPELYRSLGEAFSGRRDALQGRAASRKPASSRKSSRRRASRAQEQREHA
jgi:hypothetical protein